MRIPDAVIARPRWRLGLVFALVAGSACADATAPASDPLASDGPVVALAEKGVVPRGRIAFVSQRDGDPEIYLVNTDGSDLDRVTTSSAGEGSPAWSPDGQRIAFVSDRDGSADLYVMTALGTEVTRRTWDAGAADPAWSPDGSALVFGARSGTLAVTAASGPDTGLTFLPDAPGYDGDPSWSPDGRRLAFISDRDAYDIVYNIYTAGADGSDAVLRTEGFGYWPAVPLYLHPTWSPDGTLIAFVHGRVAGGASFAPDVRFHVGVMPAEGGAVQDIAYAGTINWMDALDPGSLAWSPDGSGLVYTYADCGLSAGSGCIRSVRYASLDGAHQRTIVRNGDSPSWRP